jgi:hypothetical protein
MVIGAAVVQGMPRTRAVEPFATKLINMSPKGMAASINTAIPLKPRRGLPGPSSPAVARHRRLPQQDRCFRCLRHESSDELAH